MDKNKWPQRNSAFIPGFHVVLFKLIKTIKLLLLLLAIFLDSDDGNNGKDREWQLHISVPKGYNWKYMQQIKTIIHALMLGREAVSFIFMAIVSKRR